MSNNLEVLERTIGKERLSRILDVLDALGAKLPEGFEIEKGKKIRLAGNNLEELENIIKFDKNLIQVFFKNNGHRYHWYSTIDEEEIVDERLDIDYGRMKAVYFTTQQATMTSGFYLFDDTWGSPKILSDLYTVSIGVGDEREVYPIEDYLDVFTVYMKSEKTFWRSLADNPDVVKTIIKMFEKPINDHVYDLKNKDQSWRFEAEESQIFNEYNKGIEKRYQKYNDAVNKASNDLQIGLKSEEYTKERRLDSLRELKIEHDRIKKY